MYTCTFTFIDILVSSAQVKPLQNWERISRSIFDLTTSLANLGSKFTKMLHKVKSLGKFRYRLNKSLAHFWGGSRV